MKDNHKDERKYCPKCGAVLGENVDGKSICICGYSEQIKPHCNFLRWCEWRKYNNCEGCVYYLH